MRGRAGSLPEISVCPTDISDIWLKILPYEHFIPVTGMNGEMNSGGPDGIVLHSPRCIFIIISIPFNSRNAACRSYDRRESYKFCISPCLLCFSNLAPELVSRIFGLFLTCFGNRAEISHMNPRGSSSRQPGQPGQPRAHLKRP